MSTKVTNLDQVYDTPHSKNLDIGWGYIRGSAYNFNLDPDYQRGHVWTTEQRESFIGYALSGGSYPPCWVNLDIGTRLAETEVIDGKQRITSILMFMDGEICGRTSDGLEIWYNDLDESSQRRVKNSYHINIKLVELDREGVLKLYLKLNSAGVPHTKEELDRVRDMLNK